MLQQTLLPSVADDDQDLATDTLELRQLYKKDLARALDLIALDSRSRPERYLVETLVPFGGE